MLSLLYHRIGSGKYSNPPDLIQKHFSLLSQKGNIVLPGDPLQPYSLNFCLTFDDATYDFYHYVFPMLKKLKIKALLAVPVSYIIKTTDLDANIRLSVPHNQAMQSDIYKTKVPFCTWEEIHEMVESKRVVIASHSMTHQHLLTEEIDLQTEIITSKRVLEEKLNIPIRTFVYPMGKFNRSIHALVKEHYEFAMRIGNAWNRSWQNGNGLIYRILSDNLPRIDEPLRLKSLFSFTWFHLLNSLRGR